MNILLCVFLFATILVSAQLEIRDRCGPGNRGTCVLVDACPTALALIKNRRHEEIEVCGWQKKKQIVCCMDLKENRAPSQERKSVEECIRYGGEREVDIEPFIINGVNASLGSYPHMAALGFDSDNVSFPYAWDCAGSLISENYVLTAAHCMARKLPVMVRLGKVDLYGDEDNAKAQDIPVGKCIPNPDYDHLKRLNDIALIRLSKPAKFTNYVRPACLHTEKDAPTPLYISGWGVTKRGGELSRFLQHAPVAPIDLARCNDTFLNSPSRKAVLPTQLCALGEGENVADTCQGDSGGPIQTTNRKNYGTEFILIGITSFGRGCASNTPGIYTRIYDYLDWIERVVWP